MPESISELQAAIKLGDDLLLSVMAGVPEDARLYLVTACVQAIGSEGEDSTMIRDLPPMGIRMLAGLAGASITRVIMLEKIRKAAENN